MSQFGSCSCNYYRNHTTSNMKLFICTLFVLAIHGLNCTSVDDDDDVAERKYGFGVDVGGSYQGGVEVGYRIAKDGTRSVFLDKNAKGRANAGLGVYKSIKPLVQPGQQLPYPYPYPSYPGQYNPYYPVPNAMPGYNPYPFQYDPRYPMPIFNSYPPQTTYTQVLPNQETDQPHAINQGTEKSTSIKY